MEEKKKKTTTSKTKNSTLQEVKTKSAAKSSTKPAKSSSRVSSKQKEDKAPQKREIDFSAAARKKVKINLSENFNESGIFDVYLYRELFMELRKQMDELYAKRNKGSKESSEYDDAVYNITSNAVFDPGAQDFLGFCYKKGFYDFCVMNYEKYMKWTILAAANGNAFSLSKLQIFLTTAIDYVMEVEDQKVILEFFDINSANYMILLSKMLCENIVEIMNISSEQLIKLPEKFMDQNEEVQKEFDNAKMKAAEIVKAEIQKSVTELNAAVQREVERKKNVLKVNQEKLAAEQNPEPEQEVEPLEEDSEQQEPSQEEKPSENKFKRNLKIRKKFRY